MLSSGAAAGLRKAIGAAQWGSGVDKKILSGPSCPEKTGFSRAVPSASAIPKRIGVSKRPSEWQGPVMCPGRPKPAKNGLLEP